MVFVCARTITSIGCAQINPFTSLRRWHCSGCRRNLRIGHTMNTATVLTTIATGLITVGVGYTPSTNIHKPDSTYAQFYVLPVVGPLSFLAWQRLNIWLPADDAATIEIGHEELAWSLGAAPARLTRSISRLIKFHLAYVVPAEPELSTSNGAPQA
jgi:hypothetical protein